MLLAASDEDLGFLREALHLAAFPPGTPVPPDGIEDDHVVRYVEGWGRPGDLGLVAWVAGAPVGAAWVRLMASDRPGYGFVDAATPELTVAVVDTHRGQGWGRALVAGILDLAAAHGHARVSLSVADAVNPVAVGLYRSLGFTDVGRDDGASLTMVASTSPSPPGTGTARPAVREAEVIDGPALARLRQVLFTDGSFERQTDWVGPFLAAWSEGASDGRWRAVVIDDPRDRPVASALAVRTTAPPAPGRTHGEAAHVSSVATEPGWRGRGCARATVAALVSAIDAAGVESTTLTATADGEALYASLGFTASGGVAMRRSGPQSGPDAAP